MLVERCALPQVVHHQNLLLFADGAAGLKTRLLRRAARRALWRATANVFISEFMREAALRPIASTPARAVTIANGLPPELLARWSATFDVEVLDGIGSAEMFHIYITNHPGDVKPGSLGKLVPGYEARIHFAPESAWDERNPWLPHRADAVAAWDPYDPDVLFVEATTMPGQGRLILTDPSDMLNTGVHVEARPPGKKPRDVVVPLARLESLP